MRKIGASLAADAIVAAAGVAGTPAAEANPLCWFGSTGAVAPCGEGYGNGNGQLRPRPGSSISAGYWGSFRLERYLTGMAAHANEGRATQAVASNNNAHCGPSGGPHTTSPAGALVPVGHGHYSGILDMPAR